MKSAFLLCVACVWGVVVGAKVPEDPLPPACDKCQAFDCDATYVAPDTEFHSDSNSHKDGECDYYGASCKHQSNCEYWGIFGLTNNSDSDVWMDIPQGGRAKAKANGEFELTFTPANAFTVPCRGSAEEDYDSNGKEVKFKIWDSATGGDELGYVIFKCNPCF